MKIYKNILLILTIILLTGCMKTTSPTRKVENMLNRYKALDGDIVKELENKIDKQDITEAQKKKYLNIVKREYTTLKFEVKNETIDGESATVEVNIEVKDMYKPSHEAEEVLLKEPKKFYTDGVYDNKKYIDYKLNKMENSKDRITYTIFINLIKEKDKWIIEDLDDMTLEKIHGIYNYETNHN